MRGETKIKIMTGIANFLVGDIGLGTVLLWLLIAVLFVTGGAKRRMLALAVLVLAMPMASRLAALPLDASTHDASGIGNLPKADAVAVFGAGVFSDELGGMIGV